MIPQKRIQFTLAFIAAILALSACALFPTGRDQLSEMAATPASLSEIDLASVLLHLSELPGDLSPGPTTRAVQPWWFGGLPDPDNFIFHDLKSKGSKVGTVALLLYESSEQIDIAYSTLVKQFSQAGGETKDGWGITARIETITDVGDRAQAEVVAIKTSLRTSYDVRVQLAFVRCSAVAHIRLDKAANLSLAVDYARQLDYALTPLVCR